MTTKIEIFGQKFAHFGGFVGSVLTVFDLKVNFLGNFDFWKFQGKTLIIFATHKWHSPLGSLKALHHEKSAGFCLVSNFYHLCKINEKNNFYCVVLLVCDVCPFFFNISWSFFFNVLSYRGNDKKITSRLKIDPKKPTYFDKLTLFFFISVQKVVIFQSCLGVLRKVYKHSFRP